MICFRQGAEWPCLLEVPLPAPTSQSLVPEPLFSTVRTDTCVCTPTHSPPWGTHPWLTLQPASSPKPSESSCRRVDRVSPRYPARALYNRHRFCRQRGCTPRTSLSFPSHTDTSPNNSRATVSRGGKVGYGVLVESKANGFKQSSKGAWCLLRGIATMKGSGAMV